MVDKRETGAVKHILNTIWFDIVYKLQSLVLFKSGDWIWLWSYVNIVKILSWDET